MASHTSGGDGELLEDPEIQEAIWRAIQAEQVASSLEPQRGSSQLPSELQALIGRTWQVRGASGRWIDMGPEGQEAVQSAVLLGHSSCRFWRSGTEYEVQLDSRQQTNLQTGTQRSIRLASQDRVQSSTLDTATAPKSCHICTVHLDAAASQCHVCGSSQENSSPLRPEHSMDSLRRPSLRRTTSEQASAGKSMGELRSLELCCQLDGRKFEDPDFPPILGGRVTAWRRPQEITHHDGRPLDSNEDWQLLRGRPRAEDVRQGELGDCWFLSSLAALAEYQDGRFVRALLPEQQALSAAGVYLVRLCLGGFWREILVDDRFPSRGGGRYHHQLAYCSTYRLQLWASIIEKAFAKACGSYEALVGGPPQEALTVLTGWPCMVIKFSRKDFDADWMWASLCSSARAEFLMTCSTARGEELRSEVGLVPNHAYSLMGVHEVATSQGQERLLQIRNPHARCAWNGAWSQQSSDWTPELRSQLQYSADDDAGTFFMAMSDFIVYFDQCTICQIHGKDWCEARMAVPLPSQQVASAGLALEAFGSTAQCIVSLAQPEARARQGYFNKRLFEKLTSMGLVVLNMKTKPPSLIASSQLKDGGVVCADCWLQPGIDYLLVPLCLNLGSSFHAAAAVMSSLPVVVEERTLDRRTVAMAWAAYAREGKRKQHNGADIYVRSSDCLIVLAENPSSRYIRVELTIESDTLEFSRHFCACVDCVAPGHAQILQVALPKEASAGTSWSYQYSVRSQPSPPASPWNQPALNGDQPFAWLHQPLEL